MSTRFDAAVGWKKCRALPQTPPPVTARRAHPGPGRSGSGTSARLAGNDGSTKSSRATRNRQPRGSSDAKVARYSSV